MSERGWSSYSPDADTGPESYREREEFASNVEALRDRYSDFSPSSDDAVDDLDYDPSLPEAYFDAFEEEYGQEYADTVREVLDEEEGWTAGPVSNEDTAPLWQAAAEDVGNRFFPGSQTVMDPAYTTEEEKSAMKAFRDFTQDAFADRDVEMVQVYRGVKDGKRLEEALGMRGNGNGTGTDPYDEKTTVADDLSSGERLTMPHKPLESWTTDLEVAKALADGGVVLQRQVPVYRIWGASITSPELHKEQEVIVEHRQDGMYTIGRDAFPTARLE